ncbi:MAG TPA: helix-turn-helix domain-containing protein [Ramlibacter sp.]|jgi:DNA-binding MarR family transcriptional regulator|uniref:helix-turn-helix domain-containing protein n=1 Tax=Ramlibacter sp. TaxID=1917967 RepID=UPI002D5EDFA5|nr:helix-turn-helix domain-containing protein [Ramlibacter sp.]HZY18015.1 helix-turn-helix domain-containing protein [Ramlibacter sp.]
MSRAALVACLALDRAHASVQRKLDEGLGTLHGLAWRDFALLSTLAAAPQERLPLAALVEPVGLPLSGVVRRLAPLEKLGWLAREGRGDTPRTVVLRPGGRRLLQEAGETAADLCAGALGDLLPGAFDPRVLDARPDGLGPRRP